MINVEELQNLILNNSNYIEIVLSKLEYQNIRDRGKYYQAGNPNGDNMSAFSIRKDSLHFNNYTRGRSGNIFTLVQEDKHCTFPQALEFIAKWIGFKSTITIKKKRKPFGGFYSKLKNYETKEVELPIHNEGELPPEGSIPYLWIQDGVSPQVLEEFGIRLDLQTNRIIIPWRNQCGELVGAKFRVNDSDCPMDKRWGMQIPFSKSSVLYGLFENYKYIQEKKKVIVFEAEKSVLIARSNGCNIGVAIGGHNISKEQLRLIKSLFCEKVVIAFDEGICVDELQYETNKFLKHNLTKLKVGYIYDEDNIILLKGRKQSPIDVGKKSFMKLYKEHTIWLNVEKTYLDTG